VGEAGRSTELGSSHRFVIGFFPNRHTLVQSERISAGSSTDGQRAPVNQSLGMSIWHQERLTSMGIDDAHNLATVIFAASIDHCL
jgi:hypothetical protein